MKQFSLFYDCLTTFHWNIIENTKTEINRPTYCVPWVGPCCSWEVGKLVYSLEFNFYSYATINSLRKTILSEVAWVVIFHCCFFFSCPIIFFMLQFWLTRQNLMPETVHERIDWMKPLSRKNIDRKVKKKKILKLTSLWNHKTPSAQS